MDGRDSLAKFVMGAYAERIQAAAVMPIDEEESVFSSVHQRLAQTINESRLIGRRSPARGLKIEQS